MTRENKPAYNSENKATFQPLIGILINYFSKYSYEIWKGIKKGSEKIGGNTICFVGGSLNNPHFDSMIDSKVFNLANPNNVDGLISISTSLGSYISNDEMRNFLKPFSSIPLVNIGPVMKDIPGIRINNRPGMEELMKHLIEIHGFEKFAFISGPEKNFDCEERRETFLNILEKYGIGYDPELIIQGGYKPDMIRPLGSILLSKINKIEAVVCFNDIIAINVMKIFSKEGIKVPDDVTVTGFDNTYESQHVTPSLTTVHQPLNELGYAAYQTVINLIKGNGKVDLQGSLDTQIRIRKSCGCELKKNNDCKSLKKLEEYKINAFLNKIELNGINRKLSDGSSIDDLAEIIKKDLGYIGIKKCQVITHNKSRSSIGHSFFYAFPGNISYEEDFISKIISRNRRHDPLFIFALKFKKILLGYILYEISEENFSDDLFINDFYLLIDAINTPIGCMIYNEKISGHLASKSHFSIPEETAEKYFKVLSIYMKKSRPYTNPCLTLHELSENTGISRNNLSFIINHFTGSNFYDYINKYRINISKDFLKNMNSNGNILEIAYDSGFNSKSTFYKIFKGLTNMTPTEYRKKYISLIHTTLEVR